MADDYVRIEVGLDGGQILGALVTTASAESLDAALRAGSVTTVELDAEDGTLLLVLSRVLPVLGLAVLARARGMALPPRDATLLLVLAGTLDCSATGLYAVANTKGALSIVAVVGSLYPVMTLFLARVVLSERIRPVQQAGVVAALAGVAMIAAG